VVTLLLGHIKSSDSGLLLHSSVVGVSVVTFVSPAKTADATWDADSGGPKEPCIRRWSRFLHGNGHFWGVSAPYKSFAIIGNVKTTERLRSNSTPMKSCWRRQYTGVLR